MRVNFNGVFGELTTLPGCSQIGVSHAVFCPPENRGLHHGKSAHYARLCYAFYDLGYDCLICTAKAGNSRQIAILEHYGWNYCGEFSSRNSGNDIRLYMLTRREFTECNEDGAYDLPPDCDPSE